MRITEAHDYDLTGELVDGRPRRPGRRARVRAGSASLESMRCPICRKRSQPDDPFMPFCSDRCRIIDLGNWASEKYVISTPIDPQNPEPSGRGRRRANERAGALARHLVRSAATLRKDPAPRDRWQRSRSPGCCIRYAGRSGAWDSRSARCCCWRRPSGPPDAWREDTGKKDPQIVVIDEVVGQWITLAGAMTLNWKSWLAAFLLFRAVRHLEAAAGAATGASAGRSRHCARRRDGRNLRRACVVLRRMVQSLLAAPFMALRKNLRIPTADSRSFPGGGHPRRRVPNPRQGSGRRGTAHGALRRAGGAARDRLGFLVIVRVPEGVSRGELMLGEGRTTRPGPATSASRSPTGLHPVANPAVDAGATSTRPSADRPGRRRRFRFTRSTPA